MKQSLNEQRWTNLETGAPLVQIENVSRVIESRTNKTVILDMINFTVPAHSLFAINGPSGSGKSTLLNILTGIDRPNSGRFQHTLLLSISSAQHLHVRIAEKRRLTMCGNCRH